MESLEDRVVPAGSPFVESPVIQSVGGVLDVTLLATTGNTVVDPTSYTGFVANGGTVFGNASTYQVQGTPLGLFQGPTLMARPGDTLHITIVNDLSDFTGSTAFGPTNLHTHGLHVSQLGNSDNVFLEIEPGDSNDYTIEIPDNHPQGLYWYHPHRHEFVNSQIFAGLSGLLVISNDFSRADGGSPELNGLTQHLLGIKNFQTAGTNIADASTQNTTLSQYAINGQLDPVIAVRPDETQVWNVANIGNDAFMSMIVRPQGGGANLPLFVVAEDGNPMTEPQQVSQVDLGGGRRTSFLIQVPAGTPVGTVFEVVLQPYKDGFNQWPLGSTTTSEVIATAVVGGVPATPFTIPTGPNSLHPPNNLFTDLRNDPVAEVRELTFFRDPVDGSFAPVFTINGETFPNVPLIQPRLNTVEEWHLINPDSDVHPFHIHQNAFQIISINGVPLDITGPGAVLTANMTGGTGATNEVFVGGGLTDVVDIPARIGANNGEVVIRMKFEDFIGPYVYHCHRVGHEDTGMMGVVNVVPEDPTYAIGQNAGRVAIVRVFSSVTGQQVAQFKPFAATDTRGVNVAVADVDGDGVYDVIVGSKGNTRVRVVDGTKLNDVNASGVINPTALLGDFFAFKKVQGGGVTVAGADVDGDGKADIIVGSGPGNQSRVQAIDATQLPTNKTVPVAGAILMNFLAYDPLFKGGVTVASGDVNGDGRIDIITGSGRGAVAEVLIINGTQLNNVAPNGRISINALLADLFPFDNTFTKGVNVATGNIKGFGFADVIVSAARGQAPRVEVHTPANVLETPLDFIIIDEFFAYRPNDLTGVAVSSFWDATHDMLLAIPASGNANLQSIYDFSGHAPGVSGGGH